MPKFTIERSFDIPHYNHTTYEAETIEEACRMAFEDDTWNGMKEDWESASPTKLTGAWEGEDAAYKGPVIARYPSGPGVQDESLVRGILQRHFDDAASEVMADLSTGDTPPGLEVAISAALDLLAKALIEVRRANVR